MFSKRGDYVGKGGNRNIYSGNYINDPAGNWRNEENTFPINDEHCEICSAGIFFPIIISWFGAEIKISGEI